MANRFAYVVDAAVVRRVLRHFNLRTYSRGGLQSSLEEFARANPDIQVRDLLAGAYHPPEVGMPEMARPRVPLDETRGPNPLPSPELSGLFSEDQEPPRKRRRTVAGGERVTNATFRQMAVDDGWRQHEVDNPRLAPEIAASLFPPPPRKVPVPLPAVAFDLPQPHDLDRRRNPPVPFTDQRVSSSDSDDDDLDLLIRKRRRSSKKYEQDREAVSLTFS